MTKFFVSSLNVIALFCLSFFMFLTYSCLPCFTNFNPFQFQSICVYYSLDFSFNVPNSIQNGKRQDMMMQRIMVGNCTEGRFPFQERTEKWGVVPLCVCMYTAATATTKT